MATPSIGTVILIPFPFSDLSNSKLRPAVVLADAERGDFVLCQVTSKPYADKRAVELTNATFSSGSLRITSYARPAKLFTANQNLIKAKVGKLTDDAFEEIINAVVELMREGIS
ncbi:MAG: type II toxin-antitoxin system PemK/MazF family toxin [Acidobacteria bacterium]|nr:type II toxin-antitoxin system PemK/MazF family toxin [Acidobacteriota bacterium]